MRTLIAIVMAGFLLSTACFAVSSCASEQREEQREKGETYDVRFCSRIRVTPGRIDYTDLHGQTRVLLVPPDSHVSRFSLGLAEPLKIEWWQSRGHTIIRIYAPSGYPLYDS